MEELIMERHIYGYGTNYLYVLLYRKNEVNPVVKVEFSPSEIEKYVMEEDGLDATNIDKLNYYDENALCIPPNLTFNALSNRPEYQELFVEVVENWIRSRVTNQFSVVLLERKNTEIQQLEKENNNLLKREQAARYEIEELNNRVAELEREAGRSFQENIRKTA